jgi:hypothetical protein
MEAINEAPTCLMFLILVVGAHAHSSERESDPSRLRYCGSWKPIEERVSWLTSAATMQTCEIAITSKLGTDAVQKNRIRARRKQNCSWWSSRPEFQIDQHTIGGLRWNARLWLCPFVNRFEFEYFYNRAHDEPDFQQP